MTIKEILEKDDKTLGEELVDLNKRIYTLRQQAVTNKLDDPTQLGKLRKEIARIQTVQTQRRHKALAAAK